MGWACRKSGIAVAHGQRLTGGATCVALQRIAPRCLAICSLVSELAPSFGNTTSNGHKQVPTPTLSSCCSFGPDTITSHLLFRVPSLCCTRPVTALQPLVSPPRAVF